VESKQRTKKPEKTKKPKKKKTPEGKETLESQVVFSIQKEEKPSFENTFFFLFSNCEKNLNGNLTLLYLFSILNNELYFSIFFFPFPSISFVILFSLSYFFSSCSK